MLIFISIKTGTKKNWLKLEAELSILNERLNCMQKIKTYLHKVYNNYVRFKI